MARRISVTETPTATGSTYPVTQGTHQDGDILFNCLTQNTGTTPISLGSDSVTVSSDSGAKFTYATGANDYWNDGEQIILTGTMPGGFTTGRRYFIRELNPTTNTFYLETSVGAGRIAYSSAGASVVAHRMTGGAAANNNCAGWKIVGASSDTTVVSQAVFADSRQVWAYRVVGTGEAPVATPTFTGTNDAWLGTCVVVREADTTGTILWQRSDWGGTNAGISSGTSNSVAASSAGGTTVITAPEDALLLYSWSGDGGVTMRCKSDELIAISKPTPGNAAHVIGYRQHGASGNPANVTMYATSLTEGGNGWVLAIPNATGGNLEKDCRSGITEVDWFGDFRLAKGALCTIAGNPGAATITYTAPTTDRWIDGMGVSFVNGGTLPTGIVQGTPYYIINATPGSNTFQISATLGGSAITISTAGSGTHQIQQSFTAPNDVVSSVNSISTHTAPPTVGVFTPPATPWGSANTLTNATANVWGGGTWKIPATDMSGGIVALQWAVDVSPTAAAAGAEGALLLFSDGTNWAAYQLSPRALYANGEVQQAFIDLDNGTTYATSGTLNTAAITHVVPLVHRITTGSFAIFVKNLFVMRTATLTGGGEDFPTDFVTLFDALNSWGSLRLASKQGSAQILGKANIQIGDGTNKLYWDTSGASFEYPIAWSTTDATAKDWNGATDSVSLTIKAASGNTINLSSGGITTSVPQSVTIDAASSLTANYSVAGQSFKGLSGFTDAAGIVLANPTYKECGTVSLKANMTGMSVSKTVGAVPAVAITANNKTVATSTIDLTGTSATYHLTLPATVTALTLNAVTLSGTPDNAGADKIYSELASGTLTITTDGLGTALVAGDVEFVGGSTAVANIVAPTSNITFDDMIAGGTLKVFTTGTQTELFSDTNTATSEVWTGASGTFDYTWIKEGYLPIRATGEVVSGSRTITLQPVVDRAYSASSGLTFGTNLFYAPGTKLAGLTVASTLQNLYSALIEAYRVESTLKNKPFPLAANGPNSFSWLDGNTFDLATYPNSITLLKRDGMRYLDTSGAATDIWAAILSVGVPTGFQVRFQQQDGLGTTNAQNTGDIDQLVKIKKTGVGAFDYTNWLVLKCQEEGYDQAEAVAADIYGTLEDQLYVFGLTPLPNGIAAGAVDATVTVTAEPTPVEWPAASGRFFSTTITDTTDSHSGLEIMQAVRAENEFNWSDLIRPNGSKFKTVTGNFYGDAYATPAGVRVVKADGVTPHPDFDLFNDDSGSDPYVPPVVAPIGWDGALDGTTVLLYNDVGGGAGVIIDTQTISGAGGYSLDVTLPSVDVAVGDPLRIRFGHKEYYAGELQGTMTATGLTFVGDMTLHPVYAAWGLDGSVYDQGYTPPGPFTMDGTHLQVDIAAGSTTGLKTQLGAWTQHLMTIPAGLAAFYGAWDLLAVNQIRQNVDVVDVMIDVPTAGALFTFTDHNVNYYRSDFSYPGNVETGHGLIAITYNASIFVPDPVIISGESVVTGTPDTVAAAVAALSAATPFAANVKKVNDTTIIGTGVPPTYANMPVPTDPGDPFRVA